MKPSPSIGEKAGPSARRFGVACAILGSALFVVCVGLAYREYFYGDDFLFLRRAQVREPWIDVFLPLRQRYWWSYRPLSIEVYFSTLHAIAGLDSFPYLLASVLAHFASGLVVVRLARQLDLGREVAWTAGLLSVSLFPSLHGELFWASAFQTVSGTFFYLLTLSLFVDYLRFRRPMSQVAACTAMACAYLSNELSLTLPGPMVLLAAHLTRGTKVRPRVRLALVALAPALVLFALYLVFRYLLIAPSALPTPALDLPHFGPHIFRNVVSCLWLLSRRSTPLVVGLGVVLAAGWTAAVWLGRDAVRSLGAHLFLFGGWLLATMVPFVPAFFVYERAAIVMEAPFALVLAAHLDPFFRALARHGARRVAEAGLVLLVLAVLPYAGLMELGLHPRGAPARDLMEIFDRELPGRPPGSCVRVRTRPGDEWTPGDLYSLRFRAAGALFVAYPEDYLELPPRPDVTPVWRTDCTEVVEVEVLHGPSSGGSLPTFHFRVVPKGQS